MAEEYDKLPKLFKAFFTAEEIEEELASSSTFYSEEKDVSRSATDEMIDILDQSIFNYSEFYKIIRALGFEGPDDDSIISCYKDIYDKELMLKGKFRFCVYEGTKANFQKLLKQLESYTFSNKDIGEFSIKEVYQSEDTYGISFDAIQNTNKTRWITARYYFNYKL